MQLPTKRRVFQVAKEFNISNEALIGYLAKHDFKVKTHMSPVTMEMYDELCRKYKEGESSPDIEQDFRKRLRDKKSEEGKRKEAARREFEERIKVAQDIRVRPIVKKEPSKEDVLKIAKEEAKVEAKAELKEKGWHGTRSKHDTPDELVPEKIDALEGAGNDTELVEESKVDNQLADVTPEVESSKIKETPAKVEAAAPTPASEKENGKKLPEKEQSQVGDGQKTSVEADSADKKKKKKRKKKKRKISEEEISASIKQTMASMTEGKARKRRRKVKLDDESSEVEEVKSIKVAEYISASDLAKLMDVDATAVLKKCFELGMMVSINQRLDMDTIEMVADEFDFDVEKESDFGSILVEEDVADKEEDLEPRPPVVTIMGHVDHGKTSLLDYMRQSNVIAGEAGGITQHIGAYEVSLDGGRKICFLDTPGHEAFTAMRARGAQATDIVILIIAADDGVQKQTQEAINHAKAAGVPMVIAINKIDRPNANPDNIKQQLSQKDILVESWGGKYQSVEISAMTGQGIDKLLEMLLLEADLLELKANPNKLARGLIIESELDRGKGPIATVLVQSGTLKPGEVFVAGLTSGRVRAMLDEREHAVKQALPSTPVRVVGFASVPQAGDSFVVMSTEKEAKEISAKRQQLRREQDIRKVRHRTLDQISRQIAEGELRELKVIVKGDVDGSVEALADSIMKLSTSEVAVDVVHKGVGGIKEDDINLASASGAIIIGFQVLVSVQARELAKKEDVDIRSYRIIYDAVDDIRTALEGLLQPETREDVSASVEVREIFKVPKIGTVAGCYVLSGKVVRHDTVRLFRNEKLIYEGRLGSLRRFKDDTKEVASGFECGIGIDGYDDIHVGDVIECIQFTEIKRTLDA